ncbi:hypothetical protein [Spirosoma panaciterrae]|uniref:hypothetical protein n=1 Tax=Spirosoma panaciterrae TaxID=496058 RepID=UPI0012F85AD9|nr:hypothetical protein [Spirosoma panaciterrae]
MRVFALGVLGSMLLISHMALSQTLVGSWSGLLSSPNAPGATLQSVISLHSMGRQLSGELRVQSAGKQDQYVLKGMAEKQQAQGTATYPTDGTVFQFEAQLQNNQLLFAVGQHGNVLMSGVLIRLETPSTVGKSPQATRITPPALSAKPEGLYRDPALIGAWRLETNYGGGITDGGFYGSTSSTLLLNADGTLGDGGSSGYASGAGVSVQSSGSGNTQLYTQLAAAGAKWYTKGNLFCIRLKVNGQWQDVPSANYYVENGKVLITDLKTGKKTLYSKAN